MGFWSHKICTLPQTEATDGRTSGERKAGVHGVTIDTCMRENSVCRIAQKGGDACKVHPAGMTILPTVTDQAEVPCVSYKTEIGFEVTMGAMSPIASS